MNQKLYTLNEINKSIKRFNGRHTRLVKLSRRFSLYRLGLFLTGVTLVLLSFFFISELITWFVAAAFIILFGITAGIHNKINNGIKKNGYWIKIKNIQAARINIDWNNIPEQEYHLPDEKHAFDADLSITGKYSLHRLIDTAVFNEGSSLLKEWLKTENPEMNIILHRQELIKEIKPLQNFRNKLILNSMLVSPEKLESNKFIRWLKSGNNIKSLEKLVHISWIIIFINIILLLLYLFSVIGPVFSIGLLAYAAVYFLNLKLIRDSFEKAMYTEVELGKLYSILHFLESYNYTDKIKLKNHCSPLLDRFTGPKKHFKKIKNLINALSFQKNPLTALVLNLFMPWDFYFTLRLEKEKEELGNNLTIWLDTLHNLEALNSIAEFAYLNPEYIMPDMTTEISTPVLDIREMGHPLIPFDANVRNDYRVGLLGNVSIITGSNMSGKSTFLKTLGCNLILANAGAPVNASYFRSTLFRPFTCIKIDDSVIDGISYFYAEVKRLKELLNRINLKNDYPLFFLVDEIFRGTNNRERLIGSRSYIKAISGKYGCGLISTHDLELVKLEQQIENVSNFHFKEDAVEGKMIFDYKLRKGPSPTTNALKIMSLEGLPVD